MSLKQPIARWWARRRARQLLRISAEPRARQEATLRHLVQQAARTAFGREHDFATIRSHAEFAQRVPIRSYEALKPWVERAYAGEADVLWPGQPLYFAKTSGTTSGSKYIPLTKVSMQAQVRAARDAMLCYIAATGNTQFVDGKMMFLSGSPEVEKNEAGIPVGRLSGISQHFVPGYLLRNRLPSWEANCIDDWEAKVARIVQETKGEDLRLISGIPPWVQMFFERLQAETGRTPAEVWPRLQVFFQGGVDYTPYRPIFEKALGRKVDVIEVFPASEGFFALQNDPADPGLLLLLEGGLFYEFIPLAEYGQPNARRLPLWAVEAGVNYALIVSSTAGLWAYDIGDTVKFTSTAPYKLRVSGRVKHFLSAFGEHVIGEEVVAAIGHAAEQTGAQVQDFHVAPWVAGEGHSYHEWFVEFAQAPADRVAFRQVLDAELRRRNPYYEDLRAGNMLLLAEVRPLQIGATREYMKSMGKLGGQNKFPQLRNDRQVAEGLQPFILSE